MHMYEHMYLYIYICTRVYIYIYIYISVYARHIALLACCAPDDGPNHSAWAGDGGGRGGFWGFFRLKATGHPVGEAEYVPGQQPCLTSGPRSVEIRGLLQAKQKAKAKMRLRQRLFTDIGGLCCKWS